MPAGPETGQGRVLGDYLAHYQADAESIVDPEALNPLRFASERRRFQALLRLLDLKAGERLLDAGCGSGWLAGSASREGGRVWAFDVALAGVAAARGRYPDVEAFSVGDLYRLSFRDGVFDAVVVSEVLEHLENMDAALAEAARILRPGGRLLVSVPYRETIVPHLCIHCNRLTPANPHLHRFDAENLPDLLRRAGLEPRSSLLLTNKGLELLRFPLRSRRWPYWAWRAVDRLCNGLTGKAAFIAVVAGKTG